MKRYNIFSVCAVLVAASVAPTGMAFAQTEILTFDDLSVGFLYAEIPNGYGGFQWDNFDVLHTDEELSIYGSNGEVNGVVSPPNVAFNGEGIPASISGGAFNLNSAYLMAAWTDGLQVEVQGFVGTTLTYDNTYTVNTQGSTLVNVNYLGVDKVNFISFNGVPPGGPGAQFGMDNLSITFVPEPSTFALAGLGAFAALSLIRRRK